MWVVWLLYEASDIVDIFECPTLLSAPFETIMTRWYLKPYPARTTAIFPWPTHHLLPDMLVVWLFYEATDILDIFECPRLLSTPFEIGNHIEKVLDLLDWLGPNYQQPPFDYILTRKNDPYPIFVQN
jgi:hypothetical protein